MQPHPKTAAEFCLSFFEKMLNVCINIPQPTFTFPLKHDRSCILYLTALIELGLGNIKVHEDEEEEA